MSRDDDADRTPTWGDGSTTAVGGTPVAVDVSRDRRARVIWVAFLAGPVIWFAHFMIVYMAAEAGCSGDGPGLDLFDPPVPTIVTLAATVVAAVACVWTAAWAWRRWRDRPRTQPWGATDDLAADLELGDRDGLLSFAGFLLSVLAFVSVLLVGLPALVLPAC
jgi:heme/copper-type cytochrome/quinol oxidase subunit 3